MGDHSHNIIPCKMSSWRIILYRRRYSFCIQIFEYLMLQYLTGACSVNHAVEYHTNVIQYAVEKLEEFIMTCQSFDEFDFCPPQFIHGMCVNSLFICQQIILWSSRILIIAGQLLAVVIKWLSNWAQTIPSCDCHLSVLG